MSEIGSTGKLSPREHKTISEGGDWSESISSRSSLQIVGSEGSSSGALATHAEAYVDLGKRPPPGFFFCRGCLKQLCRSCESPNRQGYCSLDENSYQAIAKKWTKKRALKVMWDSWTPQQKADWFRSHQSVGTKRKFEELLYSENSNHRVTDGMVEVDNYQTYEAFCGRHMAMGKSPPQCEAMWIAALEDPAVGAIERRGQWLVPYFEGVRKEKADVHEHVQSTGRSSQVTTPSQLSQLQAQGEILLQQFSNSIAPAPSRSMAAPATQVSLAEQPVRPATQDAINQQVIREALYLIYHF